MADRYGFETIATELDGGILTVTLNRPDRLNALSWALMKEFEQCLKAAEKAMGGKA